MTAARIICLALALGVATAAAKVFLQRSEKIALMREVERLRMRLQDAKTLSEQIS